MNSATKRGPVIQQGIVARAPAPPAQATPGPTARPETPQHLMPEETSPPDVPPRAYEEALPKTAYEPEAPSQRAPSVRLTPLTSTPGELPPWQRYAVHAMAAIPGDTRPMIAVVIDDAGVDRRRTARAVALPGPLTISFLTYANGLPEQTAAAHAAGHELMVHVAMEPTSHAVDPGPRVLLTTLSAQELLSRLRWGLSRFQGYVGINNHMGSRFTADLGAMRVVLGELKSRGLLFLDSRTSPKTVGGQIARELDLPYAERNVFLDNEPKLEVVNRQLALLEKEARRHGYAVAIGHPRDATLEALAAWLPELGALGFRLVPLSTIVARRRGVTLAAVKP